MPMSDTKKPRTELRRMSDKQRAKLAAEGHASPRSTLRSSPSPSKPRGTKQGMPRRKTLSPRNAKRRAAEFARCYGSKERVEWVKSLSCIACSGQTLVPAGALRGPSENAHTITGGKGRKADADTIVPLCRSHHARFDQYLTPFDRPETRAAVKAFAPRIEAAWQAESARRARTGAEG